MPKIKKRPHTRSKSEENYGGYPCDLITTDPSTYRQLIQFYYFLDSSDIKPNFWAIVRRISCVLKSIWLSVNPRLPLINDKSIETKVKNLFATVKNINRKHTKANIKRNLDSKLDKLFDISACCCSLDIVSCNNVYVKCKKEKCKMEHIICICPKEAKVPIEERAYIRDQRLKTGPKGLFQMSSVDTSDIKHNNMIKQKEITYYTSQTY